MFSDKIELFGGFSAVFDEVQNVYKLNVPWLGRDIEVWLSSCEYDGEDLKAMLESFEQFWREKETLLKNGQRDIKKKLLPYLAGHKSPDDLLPFPDVTADDFDSGYWLTSVYVLGDVYEKQVQLNFNKEDDEYRHDEISIMRDLENGDVSFSAGFMPVDVKKDSEADVEKLNRELKDMSVTEDEFIDANSA